MFIFMYKNLKKLERHCFSVLFIIQLYKFVSIAQKQQLVKSNWFHTVKISRFTLYCFDFVILK